MIFLVSIETPTRGSYILGFVEIIDELKPKELQKKAQREVIEALVSAGLSRHKINIQVSDYSSLEIGIHKVQIIPIKKFNASVTVDLLR